MKKRILVVDDEQDCLFSVKQILEGKNSNYIVICASNGMDCLKELEKTTLPDLIILDIMMPDIDGWTLYNKIKTHPFWNKIPIIFLSALPNEIDEKEKNKLVVEYIKKPFEIDELIKCVENVLKK
jgi:CheY-like chemotaxis protein